MCKLNFSKQAVRSLLAAWFGAAALSACAHAPVQRQVDLSRLAGKKIAITLVTGDPITTNVVEASLAKQLGANKSWKVISRSDVLSARAENPTLDQSIEDWQNIAKRAGADVALRVGTEGDIQSDLVIKLEFQDLKDPKNSQLVVASEKADHPSETLPSQVQKLQVRADHLIQAAIGGSLRP